MYSYMANVISNWYIYIGHTNEYQKSAVREGRVDLVTKMGILALTLWISSLLYFQGASVRQQILRDHVKPYKNVTLPFTGKIKT